MFFTKGRKYKLSLLVLDSKNLPGDWYKIKWDDLFPSSVTGLSSDVSSDGLSSGQESDSSAPANCPSSPPWRNINSPLYFLDDDDLPDTDSEQSFVSDDLEKPPRVLVFTTLTLLGLLAVLCLQVIIS